MKLVLEFYNAEAGQAAEWLDSEASATVRTLVLLFNEILVLHNVKAMDYGEAWREQGWAGNLARVFSKVSRLRQMLWRDKPVGPRNESVDDSLVDLALLAMFTVINWRDKNRWGRA